MKEAEGLEKALRHYSSWKQCLQHSHNMIMNVFMQQFIVFYSLLTTYGTYKSLQTRVACYKCAGVLLKHI